MATGAPAMKVCVVGAGAIGALVAGQLGIHLPADAIDLSVLARGATLAALRERGLELTSGGKTWHVGLRADDDASRLGVQDLVVVAVKAPALAGVAAQVAPLLGPHTLVLVAMNGVPWWFFDGVTSGPCAGLRLASVDPGDVVRRAIPSAQVIGAVVHLASAQLAPGRVQHTSGNGLVIGAALGGASAQVEALAALLTRAGFAVTVSHDLRRDIWFKLWGNMTMNPVSALTGATTDRMLDDPLVRDFCSTVMREAQQIGAHFGCDIDQTPDQRHDLTRKLGAIRTSMLQDLEAGRALEIDALLGAVREIGRHLGVATPSLDALYGLVRLLARTRGLYPAA